MTAATPPGLLEQLKSFNLVFWIANGMEMLERLAYYGLRTVLPVYMVLSVTQGGPEFDHIQKGVIYALWALVQSILPIFTGGYADRYGYKLTVAVAIAIKMVGYLVMAYALELAVLVDTLPPTLRPVNWGWAFEWMLGQSGEWGPSYWVFLFGALSLAGGTAVFKPGLQGILGHQMNEENGSVGWSVFYQIVNVGGFLGPLLAGYMRLMNWKWVFISCAVIVALNYLLLFTFEDPKAAPEEVEVKDVSALRVLWDSSIGICEPRLMAFLVVFSGFWAMFHQLFDLLPNYIDDWVDSRSVVDTLVAPVFAFVGGVPDEWNGNLPQEYMININAGMIMTSAFLVGYLTGKVRSMTAMIGGILVSAIAIAGLGLTTNGWMILLAIAAFSIGEMMSSPTKMRYFSNIAPPGKQGLYLGYINATGGIGWYLGSLIAGELYEHDGDKVVLARRYLQDELQIPSQDLLKDQVIPTLAQATNGTADSVRVLLLDTYDPGAIWFTFATMGVISMVGLLVYDVITRANTKVEPFALTLLTFVTAYATYSLWTGIFFASLMTVYLVLENVAPGTLPGGQAGD